MSRRKIVGLGVTIAVIVGAIAFFSISNRDSDVDSLSAPQAPTTTTTIMLPPTSVPAVAPYDALAKTLPTDLPGYRVDTGAKATGEMNLDAAVQAEADPQAERALLETRRYQAGYARAFVNDTSEVYMMVYDFASANDASLYMTDGFITLTGRGAGIYDVTEVPGAKGFSQSQQQNGYPEITHGVGFAKDDDFYLIFTRSRSTSTPAEAASLASSLNTGVRS